MGAGLERTGWSSYETTDPAAAELWHQARYSDHPRAIRPLAGDFGFSAAFARAGRLSLARLAHRSVEVTDLHPPAPYVTLGQVFGGGGVLRSEGREATVRTGSLFLLPAVDGFENRHTNRSGRFLTIDLHEVHRVAAEQEDDPLESVRFRSLTASTSARATLIATLDYAEASFDRRATEHELVTDGMARLVAQQLLSAFGGESLDSGATRRRWQSPSATRRAIGFIEAHAHQSIRLEDIAAAARTGCRSLQLAFRRELDTTPMRYLRETRLRLARVELLGGPHSASIATLAARWGFGHPGRFAALYRERFGRLPSEEQRPQ